LIQIRKGAGTKVLEINTVLPENCGRETTWKPYLRNAAFSSNDGHMVEEISLAIYALSNQGTGSA
jgi:hypothetical protein